MRRLQHDVALSKISISTTTKPCLATLAILYSLNIILYKVKVYKHDKIIHKCKERKKNRRKINFLVKLEHNICHLFSVSEIRDRVEEQTSGNIG